MNDEIKINLEERKQESEPKEDPKGNQLVLAIKMEEDPDFLVIKDEINQLWLKSAGEESLSIKHQDYIHGDPTNPQAPTIKEDTKRLFRERFPDKVIAYDRQDKVSAFDSLSDDPKYKEMKDQVVMKTNQDDEIRKGAGSGVWNRVYRMKSADALTDFVRTYPEKSEKYAERWRESVKDNSNYDENVLSNDMKFFRDLAEEIEDVKCRQEQQKLRKTTHIDNRAVDNIRARLGLTELDDGSRETDGGKGMIEQNVGTPLERDDSKNKELLTKITLAVAKKIPEEIKGASDEELAEMQNDLSDLPYFSGQRVEDVLDCEGDDEGVVMVDTDKIVGSVSPAFKNWSTEYDNRKGRAISVAKELMSGTEESVEHVFHISEPDDGVKLKKISGPGGDLFFVLDGSHRVSGAKLAQMQELPAQVENMSEISEVHTKDIMLKSQWETRIDSGLISGSVEEKKDESGVINYVLKIDGQVLPWMNLPQPKLVKMTKFYSEFYPDSLSNLKSLKTGEKIPSEALVNEVAMNYFLAGRWSEYDSKES